MKKLIYIFICLLVCNCSSSDDNKQNIPLAKTFLETYEGTGWLNDSSPYYFWFINDTDAPIEQWSDRANDCLIVGLIELPPINLKIIENSENKLVLTNIEVPAGPPDLYHITFTIIGNKMEMEEKHERTEGDDIETTTFTKVSSNSDNYIFCD